MTKPLFQIGDKVQILVGKYAGATGEIVRDSHDFFYEVMPYKHPDWEEGVKRSNAGPYTPKELKRVAKLSAWKGKPKSKKKGSSIDTKKLTRRVRKKR